MKGIILAGGSGTRLLPLSLYTCKQLLPVYDKPMIYYPLSILMLANIRDILIITNPKDLDSFKAILKDGNQWGIKISYAIQTEPRGLADAFIVGENFINGEPCCLVLGDNILHMNNMREEFKKITLQTTGATVFGYTVADPKRYGVVELDENYNVLSIEEKPQNPKSRKAVIGLYFYDNRVVAMAKSLKPSSRGEIEITDLNKLYLEDRALKVHPLGRGTAWFDTGTHESLLEASEFVHMIEKRQGYKIACLEEVALHMKFITHAQFIQLAHALSSSDYGKYLLSIMDEFKITA